MSSVYRADCPTTPVWYGRSLLGFLPQRIKYSQRLVFDNCRAVLPAPCLRDFFHHWLLMFKCTVMRGRVWLGLLGLLLATDSVFGVAARLPRTSAGQQAAAAAAANLTTTQLRNANSNKNVTSSTANPAPAAATSSGLPTTNRNSNARNR